MFPALVTIASTLGPYLLLSYVNWATWFEESARWDAFQRSHPRWARAIQISRMVALHTRKPKPKELSQ